MQNMINSIYQASTLEATTALSKLLKKPVEVDFVPVQNQNKKLLELKLPHAERMINIYLPITGNMNGSVFLLLPESSALDLCQLLLQNTSSDLNPISISVLSEIANIMVGSFLSIFSMSLGFDFIAHKISLFDNDVTQNLIFKMSETLEKSSESALTKFSFYFKHDLIYGKVIFFFEEKAILSRLQ